MTAIHEPTPISVLCSTTKVPKSLREVIAAFYDNGVESHGHIISELTSVELARHCKIQVRAMRARLQRLRKIEAPWFTLESSPCGYLCLIDIHTLHTSHTQRMHNLHASSTQSDHICDAPQPHLDHTSTTQNDMAQDMQRVRAVAGDTYPDSSNKLEEEEVTRTHTHEERHTTQPTTSTSPSSEISSQEEHTLEHELTEAIEGHGFEVNHWGIRAIAKGLRSWAGEDSELAMAFVVSKLAALQDRGADRSLVVTALTRDGQGWLDRNPAWASAGTSKPARKPESRPIWEQMGTDEAGWQRLLDSGL